VNWTILTLSVEDCLGKANKATATTAMMIMATIVYNVFLLTVTFPIGVLSDTLFTPTLLLRNEYLKLVLGNDSRLLR
jgi:hypothetical protein